MFDWSHASAFFFLFLSIIFAWRAAWLTTLFAGVIALVCAVFAGLCDSSGLGVAAIGGALVYMVRRSHPQSPRRFAAIGVLAVLALALGFHALPGFKPWILYESFGRDGSRAVVWQFDKGLAAVLLLGAITRDIGPDLGTGIAPSIAANIASNIVRDRFVRLALGLLLGLLTMLGFALLSGTAMWEPALLGGMSAWIFGNVFLSVLPEEVFFRGLIQASLTRWWSPNLYAVAWALGASAALFAIVHAGWGLPFAVGAGIAGVFYGVMLWRGGLIWAVVAHAATNCVLVVLTRSPLA